MYVCPIAPATDAGSVPCWTASTYGVISLNFPDLYRLKGALSDRDKTLQATASGVFAMDTAGEPRRAFCFLCWMGHVRFIWEGDMARGVTGS
jgi:hypothetical protein